jgi:hypothetical protein
VGQQRVAQGGDGFLGQFLEVVTDFGVQGLRAEEECCWCFMGGAWLL